MLRVALRFWPIFHGVYICVTFHFLLKLLHFLSKTCTLSYNHICLFRPLKMSSLNSSLIDNSQTMVRTNIPVPVGHIICHRKWQNSELVKLLRAKVKVSIVFPDHSVFVSYRSTSERLSKLISNRGIKKNPRNSPHKTLLVQIEIVFDDRLGVVDFHLSDKVTAIYLTESEMLNTANMRRKIVKFRKGQHSNRAFKLCCKASSSLIFSASS